MLENNLGNGRAEEAGGKFWHEWCNKGEIKAGQSIPDEKFLEILVEWSANTGNALMTIENLEKFAGLSYSQAESFFRRMVRLGKVVKTELGDKAHGNPKIYKIL